MSTAYASIIELLRATTVNEHRALERTSLMASLMDKNLSLAGYAQVLITFSRFYATIDPLLDAAARDCDDLPANYRYHARLPYLQHDLDVLSEVLNEDFSWQPATIDDMFSGKQDPGLLVSASHQTLTNAQTLGLLYVVEGASQGGKIITPRLAKQLGLTNNSGLSFFHHFAFQATAWPLFRDMLQTRPADLSGFDSKQMCDAACSLFQALTALTAQPQTTSAMKLKAGTK